MTNWMDKWFPQDPSLLQKRRGGLPARRPEMGLSPPIAKTNGQLPPASMVYGIAAAALFAVALYFLFTGMWLTGFLVLFPAGIFLGYALHFLSYPT